MPLSSINRVGAVLALAILGGCATPAPEIPRYTRGATDPGYQPIQKLDYGLTTALATPAGPKQPAGTNVAPEVPRPTESSTNEIAAPAPKSILHLSKKLWEQFSTEEQEQLSISYSIQSHETDRFGVITDVQTVDQSTAGTNGGAALGGAIASAAYIDRAFRGNNNYSAGANLAIGLLGAILGSAALDSAPVNKFQTRYTVKLADGEVQYFDETKSDAFRHSSGICVHVPELTLAAQGLCSQTIESLRAKHFLVK